MSIAGGFCRMRHYFAQIIVKNIAIYTCYTYHSIETWREPGPTQAGLTIAEQSRINREPIADFNIFWKLNWSGLLFWFFFAIGYNYWTQCLGKPEYNIRLKCNMIIMPFKYNIVFFSYNSRFLYDTCLSQSRANHWSIAMQGLTADAEIPMPFHNS